MNLFVSFVVLACLACSEFASGGELENAGARLLGVFLVTTAIPGLAWLQVRWLTTQLPSTDTNKQYTTVCQRMSLAHAAIWCVGSGTIIYWLGWHDLVQYNWQMKRLVLIDEILILTPAIGSLVASWFVFAGLPSQRDQHLVAQVDWKDAPVASSLKRRWRFVSLRVRVHLLTLAIPVCLVFAARDLLAVLPSLSTPTIVLAIAMTSALLCRLLPKLIHIPWRSSGPAETTRQAFCSEILSANVSAKLLIWNTDDQIINASAVGLFPWAKQLWISDRAQQVYPPRELRAIIRHELAHLKYNHAIIRSVLLLLPLLIWSVAGFIVHSDATLVPQVSAFCQIPQPAAAFCLSFLYLLYAITATSMLSHRLEYEADLFACSENTDCSNSQLKISTDRQRELKDALQRTVLFLPQLADRDSIFHPSVNQRIRRIVAQQTNSSALNLGHVLWKTHWTTLGAGSALAVVLLLFVLILPA